MAKNKNLLYFIVNEVLLGAIIALALVSGKVPIAAYVLVVLHSMFLLLIMYCKNNNDNQRYS